MVLCTTSIEFMIYSFDAIINFNSILVFEFVKNKLELNYIQINITICIINVTLHVLIGYEIGVFSWFLASSWEGGNSKGSVEWIPHCFTTPWRMAFCCGQTILWKHVMKYQFIF